MKIAVIGASGYAGGELLRLLAMHPHFEVTVISAHSNAGEQVTTIHPQLQSYAGRSFVSTDSIDFSEVQLVFLALPHGESAALIARIPESVKVVDLGADFRLEDPSQWQKYYGGKHAGSWVYGLPELVPGQRDAIKKESRVANPGCYATSISLGIAPALALIDVSDIVVVAASGTTGAGRNANNKRTTAAVNTQDSGSEEGDILVHAGNVAEVLRQKNVPNAPPADAGDHMSSRKSKSTRINMLSSKRLYPSQQSRCIAKLKGHIGYFQNAVSYERN